LLEEDESRRPKERNLPGAIKNPQSESEENDDDSADDELGDGDRYAIGSRLAMKAELSELLKADPQLEEALRLLKTWHVFHNKPTIQASNLYSSQA
jgi:hypothetical protein